MNLACGVTANYTVDVLRNFVCSFKKHTKGDIVLLLQNTDEATRDWLHEKGVLTLDLASDFHPKFARYYAIHDLLQQYPEYSQVFHSDTRDAVAQGDIFTQLPARGLHVFMEDSGMTLGTCSFNSRWLIQAYGQETLTAYSDYSISCSGSTLGDRDSFSIYAKAMTDEYERLLRETPPERQKYLVHDQTLHNHLVHSGILRDKLEKFGSRLICHENGDGVFTLGYAKDFHIARNGKVVDAHDNTAAVVHQYDRFEFLQELFDLQYANC